MGTECSVERNNYTEQSQNTDLNKNEADNSQKFTFDCRSYKDYNNKLESLKGNIKEILKRVEIMNDFDLKMRYNGILILYRSEETLDKIENSYHSNLEVVRMEKLFEVALTIYHKISSVFGHSLNFPKQELSKIDFNLISRYLAYEVEEEDDSGNITKKIIKRINFFSEEFPFKLAKLEKTILSKKIFAFAYDIYSRVTFYIRPNFKLNDPLLNNKKGSWSSTTNISKLTSYNVEKIDYIIYMFFIIEHLLPLLKEKYNFSDQVNIVLDFDNKDADTELIRFIMYYLNNYYPLILGRLHIVNFNFENLKKNISFINELGDLDAFRNIVFQNQTYKFQMVKEYYPNCLPIDYGGYHDVDGYGIKNNFQLDDFIEYTLSMILIKKI